MNTSIMQHPTPQVKNARFVPATVESAVDMERQIGRNLYRRGKPIEACVTDDMAAGYLAEEAKCADAYFASMARDGAAKFVNWNSGQEAGAW